MAGTSSVSPATNSATPPVQSEHERHGAPPGNANSAAFSEVLNQAITQQTSNAVPGHGAHVGQGVGVFGQGGGHGGGHSSMAASTASSHPDHFQIGQGGHAGHDFQQKMLGVLAYRQQLLASNIANADTPGYKAVDIDIQGVAQVTRRGASASLSLMTTTSRHLSGSIPTPPFPLKYHVPYQASADGNTVEMDVERQKFSENSLMYQFSLDRVSGHFMHLKELLQNLK